MQKGFVTFYIVLGVVVLALIIGGIFYSGTQQTSNLKLSNPESTPISVNSNYKLLLSYEHPVGSTFANNFFYIDQDTAEPKKILDNPDYDGTRDGWFEYPKISPNGQYVAWTQSLGAGVFNYGKINEVGITEIKKISDNVGGEDFVWSPDSKSIALMVGGPKGSKRIRVFDIANGKQVNDFEVIPPGSSKSLSDFVWSKSNKLRAIFVLAENGNEDYITASFSPEGVKEYVKVFYSASIRPEFDITPDGEKVAFVKINRSPDGIYTRDLFFGNVNGDDLKKVYYIDRDDCINYAISVSPDNTKIFYAGCSEDSSLVFNLSTGKATGNLPTGEAAWSADSTKYYGIRMQYNSDGSPQGLPVAYILDYEGNVIKKLDIDPAVATWFPQ